MITFQCLECDSDLEVDDAPPLGYKIHCAYCGAIFEVVAVDPLEVDWADDEDLTRDDDDDLLDDDVLDDDVLDEGALDDDDLAELDDTPRRPGTASRANTSQSNAAILDDDLIDAVVDDLPGDLGDDLDDDLDVELDEDDEEDDWDFDDDDDEEDDWDFGDEDDDEDDWDFDDEDEDSRWT